jgi:N-acetylmuramic acid 6-phosphate etherase
LEQCNQNNIVTGSISCNAGSPLILPAKFPIEVVVGAEFVTGSLHESRYSTKLQI